MRATFSQELRVETLLILLVGALFFRAKAALKPMQPYLEVISPPSLQLVCSPIPDAASIYCPMLARYAALQTQLVTDNMKKKST